eukprot:6972688-Karenia_brevis.AAC.1
MSIVPQWSNFKISPSAEYLGIQFGVDACEEQWKGPGNKYHKMANSIAAAGKSASQSILSYNSKAVSLFSYKSQVFEIDK